MNQFLEFIQWFFRGVSYFTTAMLQIAVIALFCTIVFGTIKLLAWAIKKLLKKE